MKTNHEHEKQNWRDALRESWASGAPDEAALARMWAGVEARAPRALAAELASRAPVLSPWYHAHARAIASLALIVMVGGTGTLSVAAEGALPGDLLYPIKVSVNDAAIELAAFTPEAEARAKVAIVNRRIDEIVALSDDQRLTAEMATEITENIETHAADIVSEVAADRAEAETDFGYLAATEVVSHDLAAAVDQSAVALEVAIAKSEPAPAADARMMAFSVASEPAADAGIATATDDADVADEGADEGESPVELTPEDIGKIDEARVSLQALAKSLEKVGEPAEPAEGEGRPDGEGRGKPGEETPPPAALPPAPAPDVTTPATSTDAAAGDPEAATSTPESSDDPIESIG